MTTLPPIGTDFYPSSCTAGLTCPGHAHVTDKLSLAPNGFDAASFFRHVLGRDRGENENFHFGAYDSRTRHVVVNQASVKSQKLAFSVLAFQNYHSNLSNTFGAARIDCEADEIATREIHAQTGFTETMEGIPNILPDDLKKIVFDYMGSLHQILHALMYKRGRELFNYNTNDRANVPNLPRLTCLSGAASRVYLSVSLATLAVAGQREDNQVLPSASTADKADYARDFLFEYLRAPKAFEERMPTLSELNGGPAPQLPAPTSAESSCWDSIKAYFAHIGTLFTQLGNALAALWTKLMTSFN